MALEPLSPLFAPEEVQLLLPPTEELLDEVEAELTTHAQADNNKSWQPGYAATSNLPYVQQFVREAPYLEISGKRVSFNFLRSSQVQQTDSPYHLDSDSSTVLSGDGATIGKRFVWRLLLNMDSRHSYTLGYLAVDPLSLPLQVHKGNMAYPSEHVDRATERTIELFPRDGRAVSGVLFCASRVLHTGRDGDQGHVIAGFGCEEPLVV